MSTTQFPVASQRAVTLVYSSHDQEHNNAVVLKKFLEAQNGRPGGTWHRQSKTTR